MIQPDDPQDQTLSALYKASATEQPSAGLDARILAAARETGSPPRAKTGSAFSRWRLPFALAATVLLTSTLTLMVREHEADPSSATDGALRTAPTERHERAEPARQPAQAAPQPISTPPATAKDEAAAPALSQSEGRIAGERKAMRAAPQARRADSAESVSRTDSVEATGRAESAGLAGAATGAAGEIERSPVQWLTEIRKLRVERKFDDAAAQLAAFRKRYPEYPLPEDLRQP